ncbi:hypothetical protein ACOCGL_003440 [Vibrio cholerae]
MNIARASLPDTCFSCQHYEQKGWQQDPFAPTVNEFGLTIQPRAQRFGHCKKNGADVFWNEKCHLYCAEPDVSTHHCIKRPSALEPRQESLF